MNVSVLQPASWSEAIRTFNPLQAWGQAGKRAQLLLCTRLWWPVYC